MTAAAWIAVDWGTSHLRAWAMATDGRMLDQRQSTDGMGRLHPAQFEPALLRLVEPWLGDGATPVVACGMVGSRQGWAEAPYRAVPCAARGTDLVKVRRQPTPGSMSGSFPASSRTAQRMSCAAKKPRSPVTSRRSPDFDGVLCLPGTHCKWAHISAGEIVSFRTFMTGELFALLSTASVLRHSIEPDGWDDAAFADAVSDAIARPEAMAARLFSLRAEALLHGLDPRAARARLSGLLIGAELAAAKPYWLGRDVVVIGASSLARNYAAALTAQGARPTIRRRVRTDACGPCRRLPKPEGNQMSRPLIAILRGIEPREAAVTAATLIEAGNHPDRGAAELAATAGKHRGDRCRAWRGRADRRRHRADGGRGQERLQGRRQADRVARTATSG